MKKLWYTLILSIPLLLPILSFSNILENSKRIGRIEGQVTDLDTESPLTGANVLLINTRLGAITDDQGKFSIAAVPVGNYTLQFSYIGYESVKKTDIIVRSGRMTFVQAELKVSSIEMQSTTVRSGYFAESKDQPLSMVTFSYEEIRRGPGSGGDVSRIMMSLPSVAKVNDQMNNLIVRGGSPIENAFYLDNIEIPNINHWPTQGTTGGAMGLLNVDLIRDVSFSSGGFNAIYGDRLSSVMDIGFREGNREEFDGQLDLNFAGFGFVAEGPWFKKHGSWLVSARRSYLDFLLKTIDIGTSVAPVYGDAQAKCVYNLSPHHQLSLIGVWGNDINHPSRDRAEENDMIYYGDQNIIENTTGVNWRAIWRQGYSNTSCSYTLSSFNEDFFETGSGLRLLKNRSSEQDFKLRNINHFCFSNKYACEFGLDAKQIRSLYNNYYAEYQDAMGTIIPALQLKEKLSALKLGIFGHLLAKPLPRLSADLGLRFDHYSFNQRCNFSPRFSLSYQLSSRANLNFATGLYYQNLPLILLAQNPDHKNLVDPRAVHYVVSMDYLLTENTKLTFEVYQKDYWRFPIDPQQPKLFLLDELSYRYGYFFNHERLTDKGQAEAKGIEMMVQKKLAKNFYGLVSAAYFRTRYRDMNGSWRNRVFDNRVIFSIEGGFKPNNKWEFSCRWVYAGGLPYTPFNTQASQQHNQAVLDENRINAARYPDYHSLNLRFDRRFHFSRSNLVFYLSAWNVYNRKNVASYYWNQVDNRQDTIYQWNLLPIFGLEFEL